jgi:outer membrane murein-binding lipoprotein Lpp
MKTRILTLVLIAALSASCLAAGGPATVKAVNKLSFPRPSQTVELSAKDLAPLGMKDVARIHVKDAAGKDLLCQAVDTDGDYTPDIVIFQADFAAGESKTFTVSAGGKWVYNRDQFKAYGRFVRERFDDFCWENDRIAHRMYGKALETWVREPLTSSTVDIWSKRTAHMVINDWYMMDNYHADAGEGGDFYSASQTRGCGGNGLWAGDKLWVSKNFVDSRVLANGPIRVMFELTYEPFDVNGVKVSEVKRVSLDAGQNLDHFRSTYKPEKPMVLTTGIGIKKVSGERKDANPERGWLAMWERMEQNAGNQGVAIIVDPKLLIKQTEDQRNQLMLAKVPQDNAVSYWAGFCWDKAGQYSDEQAWKTYVDQFAQGLLSPIEVSVSAQ